MNNAKITTTWWDHFLYLERLLLSCEKHVALIEDNYNAISITFMHIILSACADIECIFKELLQLDWSKKAADISKQIIRDHPKFPTIEISIPALNTTIKPFEAFDSKKIPKWWDSYNDIKHNKNTKPYRDAQLKQAIDALAGLLAANLAYYVKLSGSSFSKGMKLPKFFEYPGLDATYRITCDSYNIHVPGF